MWAIRLGFGIVLAIWTGVTAGHWIGPWAILVTLTVFWLYVVTIEWTPVLICAMVAIIGGGLIFWGSRSSPLGALAIPGTYFLVGAFAYRKRDPHPGYS